MNEIVDRLWLKTREHIGDLLDQAEQSIVTMRGLVQRAETAADNAERGAPAGGWPAEALGPHEHTVAQISDLPTITSDATGGALVQRFSDGNITTTMPGGEYNVAPKIYVDRRPALFSGAGGPPTTITGAVVGDWWLDETSMEIHKIEGI